MKFTGNRVAVALFVADIVMYLEYDFQSITIITQGSSEDYSVQIAIDTSLEDIVKKLAQKHSLQPIST